VLKLVASFGAMEPPTSELGHTPAAPDRSARKMGRTASGDSECRSATRAIKALFIQRHDLVLALGYPLEAHQVLQAGDGH